MGYRKAEEILPYEVIELIQQYVDGESIYIPRKSENRLDWGTKTDIRQEYENRNREIYEEYCAGSKIEELSHKYFLSKKSIQRIISIMKKKDNEPTS